jgi:hypothetical protein
MSSSASSPLDGLQRPSLEALIPRIVARPAGGRSCDLIVPVAGRLILDPVVGGILVVTAPLSVATRSTPGRSDLFDRAFDDARGPPPVDGNGQRSRHPPGCGMR